MIDGTGVMMMIGDVAAHPPGMMVGETVLGLVKRLVAAAGETVPGLVKKLVVPGENVVVLVMIVGVEELLVMVRLKTECGVGTATEIVVLLLKMMIGEMIEDLLGTVIETKAGAVKEVEEMAVGVVVAVVVVAAAAETIGIEMIEGPHQVVIVIGVDEVSESNIL